MLQWEVLALAVRKELPACRVAVVDGPAALLGTRVVLGPLGELLVASVTEPEASELGPDLASLAREAIVDGRSRLETVGDLRVFVDPVLPPPRLIICGAGHVGQALAQGAGVAGFRVTVVDDRSEYARPDRFAADVKVVCAEIPASIEALKPDSTTFIVLAGRSHELDKQALRVSLQQPAAYVGMVGSRRKARELQRQLLEAGEATPWALEQLRSPVGLDIGAETPAEVAVSIVAELIAVRRGGSGGPLSQGVKSDGAVASRVPSGSMESTQLWLTLAEWLDSDRPCALATVVSVRGSTPRCAGSSMLIPAEGRAIGSVGGGRQEAEIRDLAQSVMREGRAICIQPSYADDADVICGGTAEVLIEPVVPIR